MYENKKNLSWPLLALPDFLRKCLLNETTNVVSKLQQCL